MFDGCIDRNVVSLIRQPVQNLYLALREFLANRNTEWNTDQFRIFELHARAFVAVVPAACFWGASFPLALAAAAPRAEDPAAIVGRVYGANTIGAVVGSLLFSLLIIPAFGTQDAQRLLIWIAGAAASATLAWRMAVAGVVAAVIASVTVAAVPPDVIAYGRQLATLRGEVVLETRGVLAIGARLDEPGTL